MCCHSSSSLTELEVIVSVDEATEQQQQQQPVMSAPWLLGLSHS
jgi:hypothetical protein